MTGLDGLEAAFEQHKAPIIGTAAVAVVGLALYRSHQAKASAAAPSQGVATAPAYSAGSQTAGMSGANAYDSSSSDVYGLLQPQLESLGGQITDLKNQIDAGSVPVSSAPAPAPTPTPAAPAPTPAYVAPAPAPTPVYAVNTDYRVVAGDNLSKIAARYPQQDITWQTIYNANRGVIGSNPGLIRPGEVLHIQG